MATTRKETHRAERVASRIQRELAGVLQRELGDPRLAGVVVSGVVVTDDLSLARVRYVVMGEDPGGARGAQAALVLRGLEGVVRTRLAPRLGLRRVPAVRFEADADREERARLDALLAEVAAEVRGKD